VRDQGAVAEVMRGLPEGLRNIDVLVNNAGLSMGLDKVEDVKLDAIDTLLDTNVRGAIFMMQAVVPGMRKRQTGHIINIGSVAGMSDGRFVKGRKNH
jgi:3-hydroxy acid dehydrogenase/malonic semialdehyde reductase